MGPDPWPKAAFRKDVAAERHTDIEHKSKSKIVEFCTWIFSHGIFDKLVKYIDGIFIIIIPPSKLTHSPTTAPHQQEHWRPVVYRPLQLLYCPNHHQSLCPRYDLHTLPHGLVPFRRLIRVRAVTTPTFCNKNATLPATRIPVIAPCFTATTAAVIEHFVLQSSRLTCPV